MANEEEWIPVRRQERLLEVLDPVETLIRSARANEVVEGAWQVIKDQSTDYTLEVDEEL
jgi:hypothetical protein